MNALHHSPLATSTNATIMETIMKPLSFARRSARWLMAAGLALAAMQTAPAMAQLAPDLVPGLDLEGGAQPHPEHGEAEPFFTKIGKQLQLRLRRATGFASAPRATRRSSLDPDFTAEPAERPAWISATRCRPASRSSTSRFPVTARTPSAVRFRRPAISTTTNPNDTAKIDDFRLSTSDLDGSGEIDRRYIDIVITAKIDHAAFPAPTIVANQGFVTMTLRRRPVGRGSLARPGAA